MKRMTVILAAALMAATLTAGVAAADTRTPRIDRREARQYQRIRQGERHGDLTRGESRRLWRGEARIHRTEHRMKANGFVTPRERAHLNRALDRQSRQIWRLKHNRRGRTY